MAKLLILNGPNLNLLGTREPEIYGHNTLANIEQGLRKQATAAGHDLDCFQTNTEHELVERIHQAHKEGVAFVLINAGAFTHTSIALRDALAASKIPFYEIHISNVYARESFRHHSYLSDIAAGVIVGFGAMGYGLALTAALENIKK